ncbi:MAG TPA: glycoside hydrolase family 99-like domain-containing protein [Acidimicrobiales bacterium]
MSRVPRGAMVRHAVSAVVLVAAATAALGAGGGAASAASAASKSDGLTHPLVGAYYYLWNPENLIAGGSLRSQLVPPQRPPFGLIDSNKTQTATRDIANAHKAGVNFFAIDWWPYDPAFSGRNYLTADAAMKEFLAAPDLKEMKFAMFYETWNLGFDAGREQTPVSEQEELHFDSDMLALAQHYFSNPSYLHIEGRPVVYLYLTRTLTGDVAGMIRGARTYLEQHGYADPFFIGDEVYWRVTPQLQAPNEPVFTGQPQLGRIEQFDAVTSYTLYYGDPQQANGPAGDSTGYPGTTHIAADQRFLLTLYRQATDNKVPVLPVVQPGFNDRGFRLTTNHPAQPRQWLAGDGPSSTLDQMLRCVAIPEVDPALPIVMVTSWDDWNEDTGIEPIPGTLTTKDDSPSGTAYTQGYQYGGEGTSEAHTLGRDVRVLDRAYARGEIGGSSPSRALGCQEP